MEGIEMKRLLFTVIAMLAVTSARAEDLPKTLAEARQRLGGKSR